MPSPARGPAWRARIPGIAQRRGNSLLIESRGPTWTRQDECSERRRRRRPPPFSSASHRLRGPPIAGRHVAASPRQRATLPAGQTLCFPPAIVAGFVSLDHGGLLCLSRRGRVAERTVVPGRARASHRTTARHGTAARIAALLCARGLHAAPRRGDRAGCSRRGGIPHGGLPGRRHARPYAAVRSAASSCPPWWSPPLFLPVSFLILPPPPPPLWPRNYFPARRQPFYCILVPVPYRNDVTIIIIVSNIVCTKDVRFYL